MEEKKIVTLDLTGCKYLGEIHQRIKEAFDFPDFYGENWDAFWDLLWSECDADKIVIMGGKTVSKELMPSIEMVNEILQELKEDDRYIPRYGRSTRERVYIGEYVLELQEADGVRRLQLLCSCIWL